jgi:hypothetical protein
MPQIVDCEKDKEILVTWIPQDLTKKGKKLDQNVYGFFLINEGTYTTVDVKEDK